MRRFLGGRVTLIAAAFFGTLACSLVAHAEPAVSRGGLAEEGTRWMNTLLAGPGASNATLAPRPELGERAGGEPVKPPPVIDFAPRATVVVRDWRGSMRLAGPSTVLDDVRPSASARTVLVRVGSASRIAPFVQAGLGQWRFDRSLFPNVNVEDRIAATVGAGMQLRAGPVAIAAEVQRTALYESTDSSLDDPDAALITLLFAARAVF